MKTIAIRGIDTELHRAIKSQALQNKKSVNQWILQASTRIAGLGKEPVFRKYHDVDRLAGGWSREETEAFYKNIQIFERIDEDVWK